MEQKMKHLDLVQGVISRMAGNCFMLKGWAVTLVAAIFALSSKDANLLFFLIACVPVAAFWALDAYYLMEERLYRALYAKVCATEPDKIDFSMKATYEDFPDEKNTYFSAFFSKSVMSFYAPLFGVCILIILLSV